MAGTRGGPSGVPGGVWAQPLPPAPVLGPAAAPGAVGMVAPWGCRPHRDAGPMGWDVAELGAGSGLLHPSAPRPFPGGGSRAPSPCRVPILSPTGPPHQHPGALCQHPHPSPMAGCGAEARRLGQHQNLQGRFLKSRRAVLGSGVRASTEPPLFLGWVPKLRDAGPQHHPNLVAPCDRCCCCRAPNLVKIKGSKSQTSARLSLMNLRCEN